LAALPGRLLRLMLGRPVVIDGQELHIEVQLALKLLDLSGAPSLDSLSVAEARAQVREDARAFEGPKWEVSSATDLSVAGASGPLGARLYEPLGAPERGGLLVFYHGGGFVICDLDTHDNLCRFLAHHAGVRVLSIDYRLAPEHRFPAAIDDALAAYRWAVENASQLGVDASRIGVGGDSAGGNLAAGVACEAAGEGGPVFQLLIYPWVDLSRKRPSYRYFSDGFYLTESELDWYRAHYLSNEGDALDPRCSPLLSENLAGVAPAYIATAGFDPLRDEGEEYAQRLREAGVRVALRRHEGLIHAFASILGVGRVGREAVLEAAGAVRLGLA
jgi:acetyl esterase